MNFVSILLQDLPYGEEFVFYPNGPIWIKCSEVWINRFRKPVISAFQGNHYAWHSASCEVYPLPLVRKFIPNEQLSLW